MKKLQEQLAWITKTLSGLSKQVNKITQQVVKVASSTQTKPRRPAAKKTPGRAARVRKDTVLDSVLDAIKRSRKGISIAQLKTKTALGDRQLSNALYKLTKKGIVQTKARGVYVKR
jgi:predicted Rossmann fold nucleotide-binding protein DprA/Smf involved in DNA uptake